MSGSMFRTEHLEGSYTANQLAEAYDVSESTIRRWFHSDFLTREKDNKGFYLYSVKRLNRPIEAKEMDKPKVLMAKTKKTPKMLVKEDLDDYDGVGSFLIALEEAKEVIKIIKPVTKIGGRSRKILCLSDIHCPFHDRSMISQIMIEHSDSDAIVLNGDLLDAYGASRFSQDKMVSILDEYNDVFDIVKEASELFPMVYITRGNHDQRVDRYFSAKLDPHMFALAQKDILWRIANGYIYSKDGEHVASYPFENVSYNSGGNPWILQLGKTVFIHPHTYGSSIMSTAYQAMEHLSTFIGADTFDSVVCGHSHKVGAVIEKGKLLIEQGCLTAVMDYQKLGVLSKRPSSLGYAVIFQDADGNTDFNKSRPVYLGTLNYMGVDNG